MSMHPASERSRRSPALFEREESPSSIGQNASQRLVGATLRKVPQKIYRRFTRLVRVER